MQYKDYYQILGVARTANADELKRAYRKLARKYHPDVSKEKNAEERFKEVQEAYEVLKDPEKRAAYDQLGRDYRAGQQFRPPPDWERRFGRGGAESFGEFNGFSDFFSSLFGGAAGPAGAGAAETDAGDIEVTLEEAYAGARRRVSVREGARTRELDVQIPKGVGDGQLLRIGGGSGRGALLLRVRLRPHARFTVQGKDVQIEVPLAPWEAALGAKVAVPTLGGPVEVTIPAGAQAGQRLRLRGRGLPGTPAGDQFVLVKVVTPPADSPQAREAYERMQREFKFEPRAGWP